MLRKMVVSGERIAEEGESEDTDDTDTGMFQSSVSSRRYKGTHKEIAFISCRVLCM